MEAEGWVLVIGAFFSGLTGLLVATLPLLFQLRRNERVTRENVVETKANTVALNHVGDSATDPVPTRERVAAVVGPLALANPVEAAVVLDEAREALTPLLPQDVGGD